jgi:colanic acid/amylovoran biosynthesis glycosyltransferase
MKIAIVCRSFPVLSQTFVKSQVLGLLSAGHNVDVLVLNEADQEAASKSSDLDGLGDRIVSCYPPGRLRKSFVRLAVMAVFQNPFSANNIYNIIKIAVKTSSRKTRSRVLQLYRKLSEGSLNQYDVVHVHFGTNALDVARLKGMGLLNAPLVTTFHGFDITRVPGKEGPDFYRLLFSCGDIFIVATRFLCKKSIEAGVPEAKIKLLKNSIDIEKFSYSAADISCADRFIVLTVARLVPVKGHVAAIRAIGLLVSRYPSIVYHVVGEGKERAALEALVDSLGLQNHVIFFGPVENNRVIDYYLEADLFLLPSVIVDDGSEESQGVVLLEAQACGLPILATETGGIPESVLEGESAILVPPNDSKAISDALMLLIDNRQRLVSMGGKGREYVEKEYDRKQCIIKLADIYRELK